MAPLGRSVLPVLDAVAARGAERLRARDKNWASPVPPPIVPKPVTERLEPAGPVGK